MNLDPLMDDGTPMKDQLPLWVYALLLAGWSGVLAFALTKDAMRNDLLIIVAGILVVTNFFRVVLYNKN